MSERVMALATDVPAWLKPLLRATEAAHFDPNAFNSGRPELKGAWFGISNDYSGESDGRRYVARSDGWPACPTCEEDELHGDAPGLRSGARCLRCHVEAPAPVVAQMARLFAERRRP